MKEPYDYADDYYAEMFEESARITKINHEMDDFRKEAMLKISSMLGDLTEAQIEKLAILIAEGVDQEFDSALDLAEDFDINRKEVICLLCKYDEYTEIRYE